VLDVRSSTFLDKPAVTSRLWWRTDGDPIEHVALHVEAADRRITNLTLTTPSALAPFSRPIFDSMLESLRLGRGVRPAWSDSSPGRELSIGT
jgi:hypothetical protein